MAKLEATSGRRESLANPLPREAHHRRRPAPELLQAVVRPLLRREHVHDHVAEVDQHPAALLATLLVARRNARLLELVPEAVHDGAELEWGVGSREHEVVGEAGRLADIEERNVLSLEFREKIDDPVGEGLGFQSARSNPPVEDVRMVAQP